MISSSAYRVLTVDHLARDLHVDHVTASVDVVDVAKDFIFLRFFQIPEKLQKPVLSVKPIQKKHALKFFSALGSFINDVTYVCLASFNFLPCVTKSFRFFNEFTFKKIFTFSLWYPSRNILLFVLMFYILVPY